MTTGTKQTKRRRESSPRSSQNNDRRTRQNPDHSSSSEPNHHRINQQPPKSKLPVFASYIDTPNLPLKVKLLCEIIANTPSLDVTRVLDDTGIRISTQLVEDVLKLSYAHPGAVVKFFRWSGYQLNDKHSPYAWNLIVDMLGKNCMFDAMWDAIKSMKKEGLLSLATFASVFGSYVMADRVQEAIMTFEVMDQYGCVRDIVALNSLLSAICRDGKTVDAKDFLNVVRTKIRPDADTYAILLEGWETEQDAVNARKTFEEMVVGIGWDPNNFPAYDSLLNTLLKGSDDGLREAMKFFESLRDRRCYPGMRFFKDALTECAKKGDVKAAEVLWDAMAVQNDCKPDTEVYNLMISLYSNRKDFDIARRWLDDMVFNGVFPDSESYNLFFQFLIKSKKVQEAGPAFAEMIKNEFVPTDANCCLAVQVFIDGRDPYMAIKVWKCMIENYKKLEDLEETGNILVGGLRDLNYVPEAVKYAEDMIDRGIKLSSVTLSRLRQSLAKAGKGPVYDDLFRKWNLHQMPSPSRRSLSIPPVNPDGTDPPFENNPEKPSVGVGRGRDRGRGIREPKINPKSTTTTGKASGDCNPDSKTCYRCGKSGHLAKDCRVKRNCYNCKSLDHLQKECPQLRGQGTNFSRGSQGNRGGTESLIH